MFVEAHAIDAQLRLSGEPNPIESECTGCAQQAQTKFATIHGRFKYSISTFLASLFFRSLLLLALNHMNLFDEFQWRGMLHEATPELREVLAKEKLTAYIGFDPSAASLHVGSLLPVMGLARLQRFGHTPIAIAGGGTGLIG